MTGYVISVSLLTAAIILIRAIFRRRISSRLVYALWLIVVVRMVLPFSLFNINIQFPAGALTPQAVDAAPVTVSPDKTVNTDENADSVLAPGIGVPAVIPTVQEGTYGREPEHSPAAETGTVLENAPEPVRLSWKQILNAVWASGALISAVWLGITGAVFNIRLTRNRKLYKVYRGKNVYVSSSAGVPCVAGVIPSIYITEEVRGSASEPGIIKHEYTHIHHLDHVWSAVRILALTVFWWNPLVWIASIISKRDSEFACDEAVAAGMSESERIDYANILLNTVPQKRSFTNGIGSPPLKERILKLTAKREYSILCLVLVVILALGAVGCSFVSLNQDKGNEDSEPVADTQEIDPNQLEIPVTENARINKLPYEESEALYSYALSDDTKVLFFSNEPVYHIRETLASGSDRYYIGTLPLPEGYSDGKVAYAAGGDDGADVFVTAIHDGQKCYLKYIFKGTGLSDKVSPVGMQEIIQIKEKADRTPLRRNIYLCNDVYQTDDITTYGDASVCVPVAFTDYAVSDCRAVLCTDGCDPDDVLQRLYYGYAGVWPLERIGEKSGEEDWNYHTYIYSCACPDHMRESFREAGTPESELDPHKYLYLLKTDDTHYVYLCITPKEISDSVKPDEERLYVNDLVKNTGIEMKYVVQGWGVSEYAEYALGSNKDPQSVQVAGIYGKNAMNAYYVNNVIYAGGGGTVYYVVKTSGDTVPVSQASFATYRVESSNGIIESVKETETFTREYVLEKGVPYSGELNGLFKCVMCRTNESENSFTIMAYQVYVRKNGEIYVNCGTYATDAGTTFKGNYQYDKSTGVFKAELVSRSGLADDPYVEGKLLECGGFVHFVSENSRVYYLSNTNPVPLTFVPNTDGYADPPVLSLDSVFTGYWLNAGQNGLIREIHIDADASEIGLVFDSSDHQYTGTYDINPLTYTLSATMNGSDGDVIILECGMGYSISADEGTVLTMEILACDDPYFQSIAGKTLVFRLKDEVDSDVPDSDDTDEQQHVPEEWHTSYKENSNGITASFDVTVDWDFWSGFLSSGKTDVNMDTIWNVSADPAEIRISFYPDLLVQNSRRMKVFEALSALPVPALTETDDVSNTYELRTEVAEKIQVEINGEAVTGDLFRTQGNGHVDFVFSFDESFQVVPGDRITATLIFEDAEDSLSIVKYATLDELFADCGDDFFAYSRQDYTRYVEVFTDPDKYRDQISEKLYEALSGLKITDFYFTLDKVKKVAYITFTVNGTPIGALSVGENTCRIIEGMYNGGVYCGPESSQVPSYEPNDLRAVVSKYLFLTCRSDMPTLSDAEMNPLGFTEFIVYELNRIGVEPTWSKVVEYAERCLGISGFEPAKNHFDEDGNYAPLGHDYGYGLHFWIVNDYERDGIGFADVRFFENELFQLETGKVRFSFQMLEDGAWKLVGAEKLTEE